MARNNLISANHSRIKAKVRKFIIHLILILLALAFITPLILVISASISDNSAVLRRGYRLWPVGAPVVNEDGEEEFPLGISLEAYEFIFQDASQLLTSYRVTIVVTVIGTVVGLFLSSMLAYVLSRPDFPLRRIFSFLVYFTLVFNGGIVPYYILVTRTLDIDDTLLALILPFLVVPFYVLIMKNFFIKLPEEILDAARVDGASEWRLFYQFALPLSLPMLATIGLFYILMFWNDWYTPLLFINKAELTPLQYSLYRIMADLEFLTAHMTDLPGGVELPPIPLGTVKMALTVLAALPITIIFLFLQKYFVKGLTVGAFKG